MTDCFSSEKQRYLELIHAQSNAIDSLSKALEDMRVFSQKMMLLLSTGRTELHDMSCPNNPVNVNSLKI